MTPGDGLKRFRVLVTRDITESAEVIVEAVDADSAQIQAVAIARRDPRLVWIVDDGPTPGRPYIGDEENGAEEIGA